MCLPACPIFCCGRRTCPISACWRRISRRRRRRSGAISAFCFVGSPGDGDGTPPLGASKCIGGTMQQEKTMKTSTRLARAFLTLAGIAGTAAYAADNGPDRHGPRAGMMRFDRLDADQSGDITFEEFSAALQSRIGNADKDHDGKMTVGEIASEIERMR